MRIVCFIGLALLYMSPALAQTGADAVTGVWLNPPKTGYVQIYARDGLYHGKVVGAVEGEVDNDTHNPDPARRKQSLLGKTVFKHFKYNGEDTWTGGSIYDPGNGKTYRSRMWLQDADTLKLRGYIGISLFGRTEELTRAGRDAEGVDAAALMPPAESEQR